jgi:hypothetical protein
LGGSEMTEDITFAQAKKDLRAYIKLVKKERAIWDRRTKTHRKELLRLCGIYMNLEVIKEKESNNG